MPESLGREIPRILAQQFRDGTEHTAFDHHPLVQLVIPVKAGHPLDGQSIEDDPAFAFNDPPAIEPACAERRGRENRNLEASLDQLVRPQVFEVFGRRRDRHVEQVGARAQQWKMGTGDGGPDAPAVPIPPAGTCGDRRAVPSRCGHASMVDRPSADRRASTDSGACVRSVNAQ